MPSALAFPIPSTGLLPPPCVLRCRQPRPAALTLARKASSAALALALASLVVVVDMVDAELATELQRLCVALFTHAERDALKLQSERHLVANYFERIDHVSVGAANQIHSKDMTPTLRRRVMRLNALDMELYEFAQKLFIKQLGMLRHMYNEKMLAAKLEDLVLGHKPPPTVIRDPIEWI